MAVYKTPDGDFSTFQQVLVRDRDDQEWLPKFYSFYDSARKEHVDMDRFPWAQCIPYVGHEDHPMLAKKSICDDTDMAMLFAATAGACVGNCEDKRPAPEFKYGDKVVFSIFFHDPDPQLPGVVTDENWDEDDKCWRYRVIAYHDKKYTSYTIKKAYPRTKSCLELDAMPGWR